jgi:8-oxo-dGTP pyrophosphatase MutT (NUDIX family)
VERRTLVERRWLTLYEDRIRLSNGGEIAEFHLVEAPNWAGIVCVSAGDEVVLVRQYRHGLRRESLELPAGVMEAGEDPLAAAQRELAEETGYVADAWQPLFDVSPEPSRHTVRAHFFCALGAVPARAQALDESEEIEVVQVPSSELFDLIQRGVIIHGVHIGAILFAAKRGLIKL